MSSSENCCTLFLTTKCSKLTNNKSIISDYTKEKYCAEEKELESPEIISRFIPVLFDDKYNSEIIINCMDIENISDDFILELINNISPYNKLIIKRKIKFVFHYNNLNIFKDFKKILDEIQSINGSVRIRCNNYPDNKITTNQIVYEIRIDKHNDYEIYNRFMNHEFNTKDCNFLYKLKYLKRYQNDDTFYENAKLYPHIIDIIDDANKCINGYSITIDFPNNQIVKCSRNEQISPRIELTEENLIDIFECKSNICSNFEPCKMCTYTLCNLKILNNY